MPAPAALTITIGDWNTQRGEAVPLRHRVFVDEQKVPVEMELDDMDPQCEHALAWVDGQAIGTARLLPDAHIGRMAVDAGWRRTGVGAALLQALVERARQRGETAVRLHAQLHARGFYARFGFREEGEVFLDAGIPHIAMMQPL